MSVISSTVHAEELDPVMRKLMETAEQEKTMINYVVTEDTRARNKPGGGWDMGAVTAGTQFSSELIQNGWILFSKGKWIPYNTVEIVAPPEPDDGESPFVSATLTRADGTTKFFFLVEQ